MPDGRIGLATLARNQLREQSTNCINLTTIGFSAADASFKDEGITMVEGLGSPFLSWRLTFNKSHPLFGGRTLSFFVVRTSLRRLVSIVIPRLPCQGVSSSQPLCSGSWQILGAHIRTLPCNFDSYRAKKGSPSGTTVCTLIALSMRRLGYVPYSRCSGPVHFKARLR
jgi:hypothetical protein